MKTIHFSTDSDTTVSAAKDDVLYVLDRDANIAVTGKPGHGINAKNGAENRDFLIAGHITADPSAGFGVVVGNDLHRGGGTLTVSAHGVVTGAKGIASFADNEHLVNNGKISGQSGIEFNGAHTLLENTGHIAATMYGVTGNAEGMIVNAGTIGGDSVGVVLSLDGTDSCKTVNTGTIDGGVVGMSFLAGSGARSVVVNHGEITGGILSIGSSNYASREIIRNDGTLTGAVHLGGGNDIYDGRGGHATEVDAGIGDDRYLVSDKQTKLVEGMDGGIDTVKAASNWTLDLNFENLTLLGKSGLTATGNSESNVIRGNAGANILYGLDSDDILTGGKGDDMLYGGADYDTFVFSKGGGHDHICDFNGLQDVIDLRGIAGLDDFSDVLSHAKQTASGVSMHFGGGDVLTFDNATMADLAQDHFMF